MLEAQKLHASLLKLGHHNDVYRCNLILNSYIASGGSLPTAHRFLLSMPSSNVVSYNTILSGYVKSHQINNALDLFDKMPHRDAHSWNIAISGLSQNQYQKETVELFIRMSCSPIRPDNFTFSSVLPCCDLGLGRQMHAKVVKVCSRSDPFIGNNLVKMYAESCAMEDARNAFWEMPLRDLVSWNVLMSCYAKFGLGKLCLQVFRQMIREEVGFDEFTLSIILSEFVNYLLVSEGMQVHCLIVKRGFCWDRFTCNALLNMYSKCGFISSASKLFEDIRDPDVVSWTALITCLADKEAFDAFHRMRVLQIKPNSFTFGSLISACANANALHRGKQYHSLVIKYGLDLDKIVGSSIVDMYSKCGEMNGALRLFQSLPTKDVVSWNGIICGLAQNGRAIDALGLYDEMCRMRNPDHVTFIGVLTACSHGGFVHRGFTYFNDMVHKYFIKPQVVHYACIVDLLGRAGLLKEAEYTIQAMPFKPDVVIWSALLGACRRYGDLEMAKRIVQKIVVNEPRNSSSYVLVANMHSDNGDWNDAIDTREMMCENGVSKVMGRSWIEIRGHVLCFASGNTHYTNLKLMCKVLHSLWLMMIDEGYKLYNQ